MEDSNDNLSSKAQNNYALNGKIMLCSVIILFIAVVLILAFQGYVRRFIDSRRRHRRTRGNRLGLDVSVMNSIPTFVYSADRHRQPLECSVCLSEIENGETIRVLSKCNHTFHVDCIDMWFHSHDKCPLCRSPVHNLTPVDPHETSTSEETATPGYEPTDLEHNRGKKEMNSLSPLEPVVCQRKPLDLQLVGIVVEVASAENQTNGVKDAGQGSGSPRARRAGNEILSLRRIWSI